MSIRAEIWGDYACFSRPEMKTERVSYDVMTPSAARGVIESIFWHPGMKWVIDRIYVLSPIRFTNVRRNEVKSVLLGSSARTVMSGGSADLAIYTPQDIQQRASLILQDVHYVIEAHFEMTAKAAPGDNPVVRAHQQELTAGGNLIFCHEMEPVSSDPRVAHAWQEHYSAPPEGAALMQCLVTGKTGPAARLHPAIKGVSGAQSSGANLVSFNAPAFESFGHTQGENAPVGEYAAFAYTTALNYLIADREHCRVIGDTTVVCWAQSGQSVYQDLGMDALFGAPQGLDENLLAAVLRKLAAGEPCEWENVSVNPGEHFYFLGLSPNASRLSVRFFLRDSFGHFMRNLDRHYRDIAVVRPAYDTAENIPLWRLLNETVNQNSRTKSASPQMAGSVLMAILSGTPYPSTLLSGAQLRIRAEHEVTRGRAAIIKAYYLRHPNKGCPKEVLQMELNENSTDVAYTLGRMFSVYEQIQQAANPNLNATIKDKYFNSASATPASIFPLLGNLSQKHLRVLRREKGGLAVVLEKKLGELSVVVGTAYPANLTLPQQGSFQLGYYFENQARYQKKEDK